MNAPMPLVYKIVPAKHWREAEAQGVFKGSPVDRADGFIYVSIAVHILGSSFAPVWSAEHQNDNLKRNRYK
jgi:uncharacterized protein (DUF952 family)